MREQRIAAAQGEPVLSRHAEGNRGNPGVQVTDRHQAATAARNTG